MKKKFYIELLKSSKRKGINKLIKWLETTDFFTAPASTKYHLSKENGLLDHSINVYYNLVDEPDLPYYKIDSIILVALLHDICKVNYYSIGEKNVKKEDKWVKEPYYFIDDKFPIGHGEKSVILIQKFIDLTEEEIAAIRWHMGGFEPKENYNNISKIFSKYPLALYLHIADLKATYIDENI